MSKLNSENKTALLFITISQEIICPNLLNETHKTIFYKILKFIEFLVGHGFPSDYTFVLSCPVNAVTSKIMIGKTQ